MASVSNARGFDETEFDAVLENFLRDFPQVKVLRKEQKACLLNLARGKDVFLSRLFLPPSPSRFRPLVLSCALLSRSLEQAKNTEQTERRQRIQQSFIVSITVYIAFRAFKQ